MQPNHDKIPSHASFPYKAEIVQGIQPYKIQNPLKGFSNLAFFVAILLFFSIRHSANLERQLVVSTPSSSPGKLVCEGIFFLLKKKEEKIKAWNLDGSLALTGILCNTHLR